MSGGKHDCGRQRRIAERALSRFVLSRRVHWFLGRKPGWRSRSGRNDWNRGLGRCWFNIVAVFPDLNTLKLHELCLKSGTKTIVVTAIDECGDNDCDGCCTQDKGNKDELIDVESFTDAKWGVPDGAIQWADLGPTKGSGCN